MQRTMSGRSMVIRLIDPPLHEFLDDPRELEVDIARREAAGEDVSALRTARAHRRHGRVEPDARPARRPAVHRLPRAPLMQVRAIATAAARLKLEGFDARPEVMVPLVAITAECVQTREVVERA